MSWTFLYLQADLIIPDSHIECTTEQGRISVSSVLTRDGAQVAPQPYVPTPDAL